MPEFGTPIMKVRKDPNDDCDIEGCVRPWEAVIQGPSTFKHPRIKDGRLKWQIRVCGDHALLAHQMFSGGTVQTKFRG